MPACFSLSPYCAGSKPRFSLARARVSRADRFRSESRALPEDGVEESPYCSCGAQGREGGWQNRINCAGCIWLARAAVYGFCC